MSAPAQLDFLQQQHAVSETKRLSYWKKNAKIGVKILISGGTRCNLTHQTDSKGIVEAFGKNGRFLHSALASLSPSQTIAWFEENGVPTKTESTGKVFPVSDRALDVRNAIVDHLRNLPSVEIRTNTGVDSIGHLGTRKFSIQAGKRSWKCRNLIITTGGQSYPGCGTTGDGYAWASSLGHEIVPPVPALTPIVVCDPWVKSLSGLTIHSAALAVYPKESSGAFSDRNFRKKSLSFRRGSLLFTHFGFSGPAALDVSKVFSRKSSGLHLVVDFLPSLSLDSITERLQQNSVQKNRLKPLVFRSLPDFDGELPVRLFDELVKQSGLSSETPIAEIPKTKMARFANHLKRCAINVEGTRGFKKAEVTAGGVSLDQVNSQSMESRLCPGLYFAGEVLDLDGPIGGYNFQSAFSTGNLAGMNTT